MASPLTCPPQLWVARRNNLAQSSALRKQHGWDNARQGLAVCNPVLVTFLSGPCSLAWSGLYYQIHSEATGEVLGHRCHRHMR